MAAHGNAAQWRGGYPQRAVREADMRERRLYLCGENGSLCAAFVFYMGPEPAYEALDGAWLRAGPCGGVAHRLCSPGRMKGAATAAALLSWRAAGPVFIDMPGPVWYTFSRRGKAGFNLSFAPHAAGSAARGRAARGGRLCRAAF